MQFLFFLFEKHRDKTVLIIAIAVSIVLLTRDEASKVNAARTVSAVLLYPVEQVRNYVSSIEKLREENDKLRALAVSMSLERERLLQFRLERNRLRRLIGLREDSFHRFLPCEVIALTVNPFHHSVTIDRGTQDSVRVGMPVVGYRGLVGRVTQVFPHHARVLLLNNKSISVSCLDKRSNVVGMLEWERGNNFRLEFVGKEEDVIQGDTLVTSGLGRVFPKGFPVGIVYRVAEEKGELSRRVGVISMTDLNTLQELFIVVGSRKWDDSSLYDELELMLETGRGKGDQ
ncbi:MAG TPA: rod shape-determining protein MreC [Patescibacteria group bacterium]|nr:rod shape-determining protein MreC [Patescibacteria group bacterium]